MKSVFTDQPLPFFRVVVQGAISDSIVLSAFLFPPPRLRYSTLAGFRSSLRKWTSDRATLVHMPKLFATGTLSQEGFVLFK